MTLVLLQTMKKRNALTLMNATQIMEVADSSRASIRTAAVNVDVQLVIRLTRCKLIYFRIHLFTAFANFT